MNIKTAIAIFNAVIGIVFISILFMPLFIGDFDYLSLFWSKYWYYAMILPLCLIIFDIVAMCNLQFLTLLTEEDWPALASFLERKIIQKKRLYTLYISLYVQSSVICGNYSAVYELVRFLRAEKVELLSQFALKIGAAYLLDRNFKEAVDFFAERQNLIAKNSPDYLPLTFYLGFALYLIGKTDESATVISEVTYFRKKSIRSNNIFYLGLCGYLLDKKIVPLTFSGRDELKGTASLIRHNLLQAVTEKQWNHITSTSATELHIAALGHLPSEARTWLFGAV